MGTPLVVIALLLSPLLNVWAIGWSDWSSTTPGGNTIDNFSRSRRTLFLRDNNFIDNLAEWYFYRGYIAGKIERGQFFIAHESTGRYHIYTQESIWHRELQIVDLVPEKVRWHHDEFGQDSLETFLFLWVIWFPASFPLTVVFLYCTVFSIVLLHKGRKNTIVKITIVSWIVAVALLALLLWPVPVESV